MDLIEFITQIPVSTIFILLLALALNFVANWVIKKKVNLEYAREVQAAYSAFQKEFREAIKSGDKERIEKMKKKEKQMREAMMKVNSERMRASLYYLVPFMIIFFALNSVFSGKVVALSPFQFNLWFVRTIASVDGLFGLDFISWYIVTSIALNLIISKLMKTTP